MMKTKSHHTLFISPFLLLGLLLFFTGCGQEGKGHTDTTTSGVTSIGSDDSYKPLVDTEVQVYQSLYTKATFHIKYEPEDSLFSDLKRDSVRLIVAGRQLSKEEEDYFHSRQLNPEQVKIATDALAIIVNNDNPDTVFTIDQIKAILHGDSMWHAPGSGKITVVFDHQNSSNSRYMRENLMKGYKFPANFYALNGNSQVIDYVSKNKQAFGIIAVNWISNDHDTATQGFLNKIKVVSVASTAGVPARQPYPYYINSGEYPLSRDVYVIKTEPYVGLCSGLLSFITADKGQRIILLEGLVPSHAVNHIISF